MRYVRRLSVCALLLSLAATPVTQAQPDPNYTLGDALGDAVPGMAGRAVSVSLTNPDPVCGVSFDIVYDQTILKPFFDPPAGPTAVAFELTDRTEGDPPLISVAMTQPGVVSVLVGSFTAPSAPIPAGSGPFIRVLFRVAANAPFGPSALGVGNNCTIFDDCNNGNISPTCHTGEFYVGIPGDLDGDGQIGTSDYGMLLNYLFFSGPEPYPLNAADLNRDCFVDSVDLATLWDIILPIELPLWWGCATGRS